VVNSFEVEGMAVGKSRVVLYSPTLRSSFSGAFLSGLELVLALNLDPLASLARRNLAGAASTVWGE
jgi:hypothetical protein